MVDRVCVSVIWQYGKELRYFGTDFIQLGNRKRELKGRTRYLAINYGIDLMNKGKINIKQRLHLHKTKEH